MKRTKLHTFFLVAAIAALTSCSDDNEGVADQLCETIATFDGNQKDIVTFSYQEVDDSPIIRIHGKGMIDESKVPVGTRLLVRYSLPAGIPPETGPVSLISVQRVLTATVTTVSTPPTPGRLYLNTIHRSGEYIDIQAMMPLTRERKIEISALPYADSEGIADLYITTVTGEDNNTYDTTAWASLWIGPIWNRPDINGVRIHIDNANNKYRNIFTFTKNN